MNRFLILGPFFLVSGCGVLFGNIKPVEEKSESYHIEDLSKQDPDWIKLDAAQEQALDPETTTNPDISDVAFQSKKTSSIISLNSACRKVSPPNQDLQSFTRELFLGISDVTVHDEYPFQVQNSPALQTTIRGKMGDEQMMLRAVVLHRNFCTYDLMYVARPEHFTEQEQFFSQFVQSLRLK